MYLANETQAPCKFYDFEKKSVKLANILKIVFELLRPKLGIILQE